MKHIVYLTFLCLVGCGVAQSAPKAATPELTAWQLSLRSADQAILEQTTEATSVLKANTATLESIAAKIESMEASLVSSQSDLGKEVVKSADTSPAENANVSHPLQQDVAEAGDVPLSERPYWENGQFYLQMWSGRYCGPCLVMKPHVVAMGKKYGMPVDVKYIEETTSDEQQKSRIGTDGNGVPQLLLCKNGKEIDRLVAGKNRQQIDEWLAKYATAVEYPQTSTGGEPVGSIFPYRADGEVRRQSNALRSVSWWSPRGWRQNFVSRAGGSSGAYP